jgi:hypothetical protein
VSTRNDVKKSEQQLPLLHVEEIRLRNGNVLYFGDDYRRLLKMRRRIRTSIT